MYNSGRAFLLPVLDECDLHWIVNALMECGELVTSTHKLCGGLGLPPSQIRKIKEALSKEETGTYNFLVAAINKWISLNGTGSTFAELDRILRNEHFLLAADALLRQFNIQENQAPAPRPSNPTRPTHPTDPTRANDNRGRIWFDVPDRISGFTGRREELEQIHKSILDQNSSNFYTDTNNNDPSGPTEQTKDISAVCGMGGIGKTTLSIHYAWIKFTKKFYQNVIWINCATESKIQDSFNRLISQKLRVVRLNSHNSHLSDYDILMSIYDHFSGTKTLFVFDNVEKYDMIRHYLPRTSPDCDKPYVLLTSRNLNWVDRIHSIQLKVFSEIESVQFFKGYLSLETRDEEKYAKEISNILQYLPLAIRQAGAHISMQCGNSNYGNGTRSIGRHMQAYIDQFSSSSTHMLNYKFFDKTGDPYQRTTFDTWNVTLKRISDQSKVAVRIMELAAYLSPDNIPTKLFTGLRRKKGWQSLGQRSNDTVHEFEIQKAIQLLSDYSMIIWNSSKGIFSVHRLVQHVIRAQVENTRKASSKNHNHRLIEVIDLIQKHLIEMKNYNDAFERYCLVHCIALREHIVANSLENNHLLFLTTLKRKQEASIKGHINNFANYFRNENYAKAFKLLSVIIKKTNVEKFGLRLQDITRDYLAEFSEAMCVEIELICDTKPVNYMFPLELSLEFIKLLQLVNGLTDKEINEGSLEALSYLPLCALDAAIRTEDATLRSSLHQEILALYKLFYNFFEQHQKYSSTAKIAPNIIRCLIELNKTDEILIFLGKVKLDLNKLRLHEQRHPNLEWMNLADAIFVFADHSNCASIKTKLFKEALRIYTGLHEINKHNRQVFNVNSPDIKGIMNCFMKLNEIDNILDFSSKFQEFIKTSFPTAQAIKLMANFSKFLLICARMGGQGRIVREVLSISEECHKVAVGIYREGERHYISLKLLELIITCRLVLKINPDDCLRKVSKIHLIIHNFSHNPKYLNILSTLAQELRLAGYLQESLKYSEFVEDRQSKNMESWEY